MSQKNEIMKMMFQTKKLLKLLDEYVVQQYVYKNIYNIHMLTYVCHLLIRRIVFIQPIQEPRKKLIVSKVWQWMLKLLI